MRFKTDKLAELDKERTVAAWQAQSREVEIFKQLCGMLQHASLPAAAVGRAIAVVDVSAGFAEVRRVIALCLFALQLLTMPLPHQLAVERGFCRPTVEEGDGMDVRGGRHAVVEAALLRGVAVPGAEASGVAASLWQQEQAGRAGLDLDEAEGEDGDDDELVDMGVALPRAFVANDLQLNASTVDDATRSWLITGPNMGGKSTFLRQVAHMVILAQVCSAPLSMCEATCLS